MAEIKESSSAKQGELVITRIFDAPRALVFKAWSDPKYVRQWRGPRDFTAPFCEIDFRVGGFFHYCMKSPAGKDYWNKGVYQEIVIPERIVNTMYFSDANGNFVEPAHYGVEGMPSEMLDVVTFSVHERDRTKITLHRNHSVTLAKTHGEDKGWNQSLDRFAAVLETAKKFEE
jgi:uncharacterized protein YndB with AHSA1/START domain